MKIGIIGAGQLGRMLALAGYPLGINCTFLDSDSNSPAGLVSAIHVGEMDNIDHLNSLAAEVDIFHFHLLPLQDFLVQLLCKPTLLQVIFLKTY